MRLSSLKLSGFKSFADSTTLQFKSNRSAVVGPNGCGKSNVIDAIRWVMGESNARQLRGGQMQDVIFTGTAKRHPVGMASVELRFENTYGKLGGAYNAYTELAVRRQVTREGKSEYFLNGTKCRRRDITDIFLGTGLGPRSYAIIEQGMINRLVDAKPEEMRVYIEEAAGVSRYQARRRETLTHLEHTTQNLSRLEDIALELKSQLKTLKKQADAAIQYQQLEQEIFTLKVEILSVQANHSLHLKQTYTEEMTQLGNQFRLVQSELNQIEHDLHATQSTFQNLIQQSTPLQQQWQDAEQTLSQLKLQQQQQLQLVEKNKNLIQSLVLQKQQYQQQLQQVEQQQQQVQQDVEQQLQQCEQQQQCSQTANHALNNLKEQQQQHNTNFLQLKMQLEKQQQKKEHMLNQSTQLTKNLARIEQQKNIIQQQLESIHQQQPEHGLAFYQQQRAEIEIDLLQLEQRLQKKNAEIEQLQQQYQSNTQTLQKLQTELQVLAAEQKNLQNLSVKHQHTQQTTAPLLALLQLHDDAKPHAAFIEKYLAQWLKTPIVTEFKPDQARQLKSCTQPTWSSAQVKSLADWIIAPENSLWANVGIVETFTEALQLQAQLQIGQSVLSLDGYHVGTDWVIGLAYDEISQVAQGGLSHRIRLEEIAEALVPIQQHIQQLQPCMLNQQQQLEHAKTQLKQGQQQKQQQQKQLQQLAIDEAKAHSAQQAFAVQQQQLSQQLTQLQAQAEEDAMQQDDLEIDLHALQFKIEQQQPHYQQQHDQLIEMNQQLEQQQQQVMVLQQQFEKSTKAVNEQQQQLALFNKDLQFIQQQFEQSVQQEYHTQQQLNLAQDLLPQLNLEVAEQQEQVTQLKQQLNSWQHELNHLQQVQENLSQQRQQRSQQQEQQRSELEEKRLAWQAEKTNLQHYQEQLIALQATWQTDLTICIEEHQQKLNQSQQRLQKIGAVNLTASAEYDEVLHRFNMLDHQIQDLQNTVNQLKAAMKSIDQETRKLFMDTFQQINRELQHLFPKVFNGGEASLSLEDDWQSGVKLMARPPGKRNSSLALLSGGEKALTALALVFAIFRLNPAPFCVLDEVDAPLDDANVTRFCNLVKELSEQVQFIYITHNKLAMTMATDLLGVTMPEAGTSKLVAVNLEQAKEYSLAAES